MAPLRFRESPYPHTIPLQQGFCPTQLGIAAVLIFLSGPTVAFAQDPVMSGTVSNVIDGDTFDLCDATLCTRIRLCGINSPERGERGYAEAKQAMQAMVEGKEVRCRQVGQGTPCDGRSRPWNNNRAVAQCLVAGDDVAAAMVRKGHACDWTKFSGGHYGGRSCP